MDRTITVRHQQLKGKTVASTDTSTWTNSLVYTPPDQAALEARGKLFVVADISAKGTFNAHLAGKLILDSVEETYYSSLDGSPLQALEKATLTAHHRIIDLTVGPQGSGVTVDFNLAAVALWGQVLYIAKLGTTTTSLLRNGVIQDIGEGELSKILISSGLIKDNDVVIMGNSKFREKFSKTFLQVNLDNLEKEVSYTTKSPEVLGLVLRLNVDKVPGEKEIISFQENKHTKEKPAKKESLISKLGNVFTKGKSILAKSKNILKKGEDVSTESRNISAEDRNTEKVAGIKPLKSLASKINLKTHLTQMSPRKNKKKKLTTLIAVIAIIFTGSVVFTLARHRTARISKEALDILTSAGTDLEEALGLVDLNNRRAHELASNAKEKLESAKEYGAGGQADELLAKAENVLGIVSKTVTLTNLKLVYDFKIQNENSNPTAIYGIANTLFIADPGAGTLYELSLTEPVTIKELESEHTLTSTRLISSTENNVYGVDNDGLFRINLETQELDRDAVTLDGNWENIKAVSIFVSNIYLLDSASDQIIRFVGTDTGFADGCSWITGEPDLPVPIDMAINGEIFILSQNGQIFKFSRGKRDPFNLDGVDSKLVEPIKIYTNKELDYIYILDRGTRRVIVTTTEGTYKKQYTYQDGDAWDDLKDLWVEVEVETQKLYILSGTRVYKVPLE